MNNFKRTNIIFGWISFLIALVVYIFTIEESVSLWDCGEFISASDKLQIVHPPGAPLFLMIGRFFAIFAEAGTNEVAIAVNMVSVVASAATVMFTFWITTHFAKKILNIDLNATSVDFGNSIAIIGSGLVAALSVTFMDTFWFSAVEAEVYAASSCFMALAFWAILKWECVKDEPTSDRWIVFVAYVVGLGIGLHLLNLLVVPAVFLYYFLNKYEVNRMNVIKAAAIGLGSIGLLQFIVIPKTPAVAAFFDKIFVNGLGLPYNSGVLFFMVLLGGLIAFGLYYTKKMHKPILNLTLLCFAFIMLGFSSYSMVVIRSSAEPAINMNDPQDAQSLMSYINREQYGERPLFYGPYWTVQDYYNFTGQGLTIDEGRMQYRRGEDGYEEIGNKLSYKWDEKYSTVFPRMGDMTEKAQFYPIWSGMEDMYRRINVLEQQTKANPGDQELQRQLAQARMTKPSFKNNMKFFWNYQIGWMYMRYFMWNFVGRQNDLQNVNGNPLEGNWLSGISFIDQSRLGPQDNIPASLMHNKARNTYYFLPFILGLLGIFIQYKKGKMDFYSVLVMFIFTGLLVIVYLNQPPMEPRERDYTFAGSFQTFCIWIGLSVLAIVDMVKRYINKSTAAVGATILALLAAPVLMGSQNWDDHDRSDRQLAISFAKNYLNSCEENAILFTNGDNDTYPLWYAQNVEGYRSDVRIINLSLLPTEWYSSALRKQVFESEPLPMSIPAEKLVAGKRDYIRYYDTKKFDLSRHYNLDEVLDYMTSDEPSKMVAGRNGPSNYFPVKNFRVNVDKEAVIASGFVPAKDTGKIVDRLEWNIGKNGLSKGDIVVLDIIATNAKQGWKRPIYWTTTTGSSVYLNLDKYLRNNGLTYQLLPIEANRRFRGMDDMELLYKRLMEDYEWGGMEKGELFLDDKAKLVPQNLRSLFVQIADFYSRNGESDTAVALVDECFRAMPESILPMNLRLKAASADVYYKAEQTEKGDQMITEVADEAADLIRYFKRFKRSGIPGSVVDAELRENLEILRNVAPLARQYKREDIAKEYEALFNQLSTGI